jgi:hypothetical protein
MALQNSDSIGLARGEKRAIVFGILGNLLQNLDDRVRSKIMPSTSKHYESANC